MLKAKTICIQSPVVMFRAGNTFHNLQRKCSVVKTMVETSSPHPRSIRPVLKKLVYRYRVKKFILKMMCSILSFSSCSSHTYSWKSTSIFVSPACNTWKNYPLFLLSYDYKGKMENNWPVENLTDAWKSPVKNIFYLILIKFI